MKKYTLLLFLFTYVLFAQSIKELTLTTERSSYGLNESAVVQVSFTVPGKLQTFPAFSESDDYSAALARKSQQYTNSYSNINGKVTREQGWKHILLYQVNFNKKGKVHLPGLQFTVGDTTYTSNSITFTVGEKVENVDVKVKFIQSHVKLYKDQQSKLTLRIMVKNNSRSSLSNDGVSTLLKSLKDKLGEVFRLEPLNKDGVTPDRRLINGISYSIYDISYEVTALKVGDYRFGPFTLNYFEEEQSSDPYGMGFGGSFFSSSTRIPKAINTPALAYSILKRPRAPKGFKGAMSRIILEGRPSKTNVKAGESLTLDFSLKGKVPEGVLKSIDLPEIDNAEVFSPETKSSTNTKPSGIYSQRDFSFMIIPKREGTLEIPAISYVWFDVRNGEYITESIGPFTIRVTKGDIDKNGTKRYLSQSEISEVGEDIQYILTELPNKAENIKPYRERFYHILLLFPWIVALLLFIWKLRTRFLPKNVQAEIRRKAYSNAQKALDLLEKGDKSLSPISIFDKYLEEKTSLLVGSMKRDELQKALELKNLQGETILTIQKMLDNIEMARYAGVQQKHESLDSVRQVLKKLEKEL